MNIPVYRGHVRQRGFGLGGTLRSIGSNVIPYMIDNFSGSLIKEVTEGIEDIIKEPKKFKHVAKHRGKNIGKNIATTLFDDFKSKKLLDVLSNKSGINNNNNSDNVQSGSGRRKRRFNKSKNYKKYNKKRNLDYFD